MDAETSFDIPNVIREVKNLNANENRAIRGERQFEFEKSIDKLAGEPIAERFLTVREKLFKDVLNDSGRMDQLISDKAPPTYPDRKLVSEKLLPNYYKLIDKLHDEISKEPDISKKAEMGKRLAVLSYFTGVTIHQAPDGNGQTNKLIALSYIREFCPQYKDNFFPIKYDDGGDDGSQYDYKSDLKRFSKEYFKKITSTLPPEVDEEDQKLFEAIIDLRKIDRRDDIIGSPDEGWEKYWNQSSQKMVDVMKNSGFEFSEESKKYMNGSDHSSLSMNARSEISDFLNKKYPGYHFSIWGDVGPAADSTVAKEFAMMALLTESDGRNFLESYVRDGSDVAKTYTPEVGGEKRMGFYSDTANTFLFLENEFDRVLTAETRDVHYKKHDNFNIRKADSQNS